MLNKSYIPNSYFIVGVQSDNSVYKIKQRYPVMNNTERVNFIKEIPYIDRVILYDNPDQTEYLKKNKIDIFIIGPEYGNSIDHKNTLQYCKKNNIEIKIINRTEGISTTNIINRISNLKQ